MMLIVLLAWQNWARPTGPASSRTNDSQALAEGLVDVAKSWTYVGKFQGRIVIVVSGTAILNPAKGPLGPEGIGTRADDTFPLPGQSAFCALARFGDHIEKVGAYRELYFDSSTELFLGPNDEVGQEHGPGFKDNSGSWSYKVLSVSEGQAQREPSAKQFVVRSTEKWQDSGIRVNQGETIRISATGSVVWDEQLPAVGPDGTTPANEVQDPSDFPVREGGCGSLIMKVGQVKYPVGHSAKIVASTGGPIEFMINDRLNYLANNKGSFTVSISVEK